MKLHPKVAICIPGGPLWDSEFSLCLNMLTIHILTRPAPKGIRQIQFMLINERGSNLPKIRQSLLEKAIAGKCDYALFIDTDQTFPSNLLYRLMTWDKPIVACNIPTKSIPATPTARSFNEEHPYSGDVIYSDPDKHGLEKVWRVGTGIMLINLEDLQKIEKPWFGTHWVPAMGDWLGEDWFFLQKADLKNIPCFIDHDLSREVGHRGVFTVTHDWVGQVVRQEVVEEPAILTP